MTELTEQDIQAGIAPRSDQVNADDLIAGPLTVTITGARLVADKDQPWHIDLAEFKDRPFKPCLTMRRLMSKVLGKVPKRWIGEKMTLYRDPQVKYKQDTVGGARISHFSALTEPETVRLTDKRGSKMDWVVCPIESEPPAPPPPGVSQERLDWLKVGWAKKHDEILDPESDKKLLFAQWVQQTLGEDYSDDGKFDVNDHATWSVENMEQCEKEIEAIPGD